jgi:hypothetical protein
MKPELSFPDGETAASDLPLRQGLNALAPAADTGALQQRVLGDWQARQPVRGGFALQRRWLLGSAGLAVGLVLAVGLWVSRSDDPVLQELLQPDVLSQMAADQI